MFTFIHLMYSCSPSFTSCINVHLHSPYVLTFTFIHLIYSCSPSFTSCSAHVHLHYLCVLFVFSSTGPLVFMCSSSLCVSFIIIVIIIVIIVVVVIMVNNSCIIVFITEPLIILQDILWHFNHKKEKWIMKKKLEEIKFAHWHRKMLHFDD